MNVERPHPPWGGHPPGRPLAPVPGGRRDPVPAGAHPDPVHAGGVDLADVGRLRDLLDRWGATVLRRVCTPTEAQIVHEVPDDLRAHAFAASFGLKEAAMKAAGGMPTGGRFTDTDSSEAIRRIPELAASGAITSARVAVRGPTRAAVDSPADAAVAADVVVVEPDLLLCILLFRGGER